MSAGFESAEALPAREILTVSQLNRAVAGLLERSIPPVWVRGELSNFTRAASGHWYFTLKDAGAQVRGVMFRSRAQAAGFVPREGERIEVRALASLYAPRGDFQLTVEAMRRAGTGDLHQQFLALKARLQSEGLLDEDRKRPLPDLPRGIAIVTSLQAAALQDVLSTLARRAPHIPVLIVPTPVQGDEAPASIVRALRAAGARTDCDVVLLVRGGGSIEDLWAFNDEAVARAIVASPLPVVSGVGHESDFTIADLVADWRAPTPTGAATAASPLRAELVRAVQNLAAALDASQRRLLRQSAARVDHAARLLRSPSEWHAARTARLRGLAERLRAAQRHRHNLRTLRVEHLAARVLPPDLARARERLARAASALVRGTEALATRRQQRLASLEAQLGLVSPQAVLERGYAIVRTPAGTVLRSVQGVAPGTALALLLSDGELPVRTEPPRP